MTLLLALNFQFPSGGAKAIPVWWLLVSAGYFSGRDGRNWQNSSPQAVIDKTLAAGENLPIDIEHSTHIKGPKGEPTTTTTPIPVSTTTAQAVATSPTTTTTKLEGQVSHLTFWYSFCRLFNSTRG